MIAKKMIKRNRKEGGANDEEVKQDRLPTRKERNLVELDQNC